MSTIRGTNINAPVVPFDTDDIFASHMAKYGHGGWRTAEDLNERDAIKELRRENLMVCAIKENSYNNSTQGDAFYILDVNHDASTSTSLLDNNNWIPLEFGGDAKHWVLPPPPRSFYPGNQGERSYDEDFIYICILDNVWKRVAFDFFEDGFQGTSGNGTAGHLANGVVPIWCDDQWCFNTVVSNVESTSGGTDGMIDLLVTFTDGTQKLIPLGVEEHWTFPVPLTTYSAGKMGDRSYDDNFFYICIQDNVWKRVAYDFFVFNGGSSGTSGTLVLPNGVVPIWNNVNKSFDYDLVVADIETTSGTAGNVLVTYTDKTQKLLAIFSGMSGTSGDGDNWTLPAPLSSASTGSEGERSYDDDFLYICVQDDLWKRINLDLFLFSGSTSGTSGIGLDLPNGVVPIWNDNSDFFEYGLVVENTDVTTVSGTSFINVTYTDNSSTSFQIVGGSGGTTIDFLNDINDVNITSPVVNQVLTYSGSNWVNMPNDGSGGNGAPDYTTAGLASSSWVTNNFVNIDDFNSATTGINNTLIDLQNQINSTTSGSVSGSFYTATATTTITSTGAILTPTTLYNGTAIGSNTISANTLQVGDTIKTKLKGYLNVSVTGVFAFDVQLGGSSLGSASSIVIAHPKTDTLIELDFEFTVRSVGATGSVIGQGSVNISLGSVATPALVQLVKTTTTTIDTTTSNLLDYLIDWNSGFTGNINITNAIIEK
jgi:hypothetical protein